MDERAICYARSVTLKVQTSVTPCPIICQVASGDITLICNSIDYGNGLRSLQLSRQPGHPAIRSPSCSALGTLNIPRTTFHSTHLHAFRTLVHSLQWHYFAWSCLRVNRSPDLDQPDEPFGSYSIIRSNRFTISNKLHIFAYLPIWSSYASPTFNIRMASHNIRIWGISSGQWWDLHHRSGDRGDISLSSESEG